MNQVYYWRIFYKSHKNIIFTPNLKQKLLRKVIKNAKLEGLCWEIQRSIIGSAERKCLKWRMHNCLIKSREYFSRLNICKHFKSLQDKGFHTIWNPTWVGSCPNSQKILVFKTMSDILNLSFCLHCQWLKWKVNFFYIIAHKTTFFFTAGRTK